MTKYYKFLTADNKGEHSRFDFTPFLPHDGKPGKWLPKISAKLIDIIHCGYHACEGSQISTWSALGNQLFEVELGGIVISDQIQSVAQQMRFIRKIEQREASQ